MSKQQIIQFILRLLFVLALVMGILYLTSKLSGCMRQKQQTITSNTLTDYQKQQTIDSMASVAVADTVARLRLQMQQREATIRSQADRILSLKKSYTQAVEKYTADAVAHTPACDSVVSTSNKVITAQQQQIDTLSRQVADSEHKAASQESLITVKNTTIATANTTIAALQQQVKRTWWERNAKYVAFGAGLLVGVSTAAFVTR